MVEEIEDKLQEFFNTEIEVKKNKNIYIIKIGTITIFYGYNKQNTFSCNLEDMKKQIQRIRRKEK